MTAVSTAAVVAVLGAAGSPVGCGVLVGPTEVLTCAHVVNLALGRQPEGAERPAGMLRVVFFAHWPLAGGRNEAARSARISSRLWVPMEPVTYLGDLALLEVDGPAPEGVRPVRLGRARSCHRHRFSAVGPLGGAGFRFEVVRGEIDDGAVTTRLGQGEDPAIAFHREPRLQLRRGVEGSPLDEIVRGFSGTPLFDADLDAYVGVVQAVRQRGGDWRAQAIPTQVILDHWPELRGRYDADCPYRMLRPFGPDDGDLLAGRGGLYGRAVEGIRRYPLYLVSGASGVGKTSLMRALVIPRLAASEHDIVVETQLTAERGERAPVWDTLADALVRLGPAELATDLDYRARVTRALVTGTPAELAAQLVLSRPGQRLFLVVDQFEAIFQYDAPLRADVCRRLSWLAPERPVGPALPEVHLVLVVRADVAEQVRRLMGRVIPETGVPALDRDDLVTAIVHPLRTQRYAWLEDGLAQRIAGDLAREPQRLLTLQAVMTRLWQERDPDGRISLASYQRHGGSGGFLGQHVDAVLAGVADTARQDVDRLLLHLVAPLDIALPQPVYGRRTAFRDELDPVTWETAERLAASGVVALGAQAMSVDLAHDGLIGASERIAGLVGAHAGFLRWRRVLRGHIETWRRHGESSAHLLRGSELSEAVRRQAEHAPLLSEREARYVGASLRHRRRRRGVTAAAAAVALVLVAGLVTVWHRQTVDDRTAAARRRAEAARAALAVGAAAGNLRERLLVDLRAFTVADTADTSTRIHDDFVSLRLATRVIDVTDAQFRAVSPDATRVVTTTGVTNRFTVHRLDTGQSQQWRLGDDVGLAGRLAFVGPDLVAFHVNKGRASGGFDSLIVLWDLRHNRPLRRIDPHTGDHSGREPAVLNADRAGTVLAFGEVGARTISMFDPRGAAPTRTLDVGAPLGGNGAGSGARVVAVRDRDHAVVLGTRDTTGAYPLLLVSPTSRQALKTVANGELVGSADDDVVMATCYQPSSDQQQHLVVYGLAAQHAYLDEPADESKCGPAEFRLDASRRYLLARYAGRGDGPATLAVWSLDGRRPDRRFAVPASGPGERTALEAADLGGDGSGRVSFQSRDTAVALRIPPYDTLDSSLASAENAAITPDGATLCVQLVDGSVAAWALPSGARRAVVPSGKPRHPLERFLSKAMAVSPDGKLLATSVGGTADVTVWELPGLHRRGVLSLPHLPFLAEMNLTFTGNAELLAFQGDMAAAWDLNTMRERWRPITLQGRTVGAEPVNPRIVLPALDHAEVVVIDSGGQVQRVALDGGQVRTGSQFQLPVSAGRDVVAAAADRTGTFLAVATANRVDLWDLAAHRHVDRLSLDGRAYRLAFGTSSDRLVVDLASDRDRPTGAQPGDLGVTYTPQPGARRVTWDRGAGPLHRRRVRTEHVAPGGVLYEVVPAPRLIQADPPQWTKALCRILRPDDLPADLVGKLPRQARGQPSCAT